MAAQKYKGIFALISASFIQLVRKFEIFYKFYLFYR